MLNEEQITALKLEKEEAKARCKNLWEGIQILRKELKALEDSHEVWRERYESADRELAFVDGRYHNVSAKQTKGGDVELSIKLSKQQILKIAEDLGIDLEGDVEPNDGEIDN